MHISYKPLWHTLLERDMRKEDLRLAAGMTTNMIANMSKEGKHISMDTSQNNQYRSSESKLFCSQQSHADDVTSSLQLSVSLQTYKAINTSIQKITRKLII